MRKNAAKSKSHGKALLTKDELKQLRAEEEAAGIPKDLRLPKRFTVIPKEQRKHFPPEAFEDRNTKVKISMYVDLDVLEYFKARARSDDRPIRLKSMLSCARSWNRNRRAGKMPRRSCARRRASSMPLYERCDIQPRRTRGT